MKLLLVNHQDPADINSFSGISYFMSKVIKRQFKNVVEYNSFESESMIWDLLAGDFKKNLMPFGRGLNKYIETSEQEFDFILCQGGNAVIPFYEKNIPIAYWHDSTWNSRWRNHRDGSSYIDKKGFQTFKTTFHNLYTWDKKAMERSDLIIFSSDYIAEAAAKNYKIPVNKIKVIPFGANLINPPSASWLMSSLTYKTASDTLNLAFIGKDWKRKGLVSAINLTHRLNRIGIKTKLNVLGCNPSIANIRSLPHINLIGFIDKSKKADLVLFEQILEKTHFLVHPATAEPFGIVLCEANAYGIPVIGTNVDGLKTIVSPGKNGFLFNKNRLIRKADELLQGIFLDLPNNYPDLFHSTLAEYHERLNWEVNVDILEKTLTEYL